MATSGSAARYIKELLQIDPQSLPKVPYIKPSSLARGCLLYVAFELRGEPKPELEARVGRILSVGTDSHRRLQRALGRACLGQEVFFEIPEYRIHGFCDGILYTRPDQMKDPSDTGFWALEFKTTSSSEFDAIRAANVPKEEHIRQAQIYLWGLAVYFQEAVPFKGAIIYYENRDTLDHMAFEILADPEGMAELLVRVKTMLEVLERDQLPMEDTSPPEHWSHRYCPYLAICEPGRQAMEWQAKQPKTLPDSILAEIIAKRIVAKKAAKEVSGKPKTGTRTLADLARELEWDQER
jgi:hypothetical protein